MMLLPPSYTLFPYTTLFRSQHQHSHTGKREQILGGIGRGHRSSSRSGRATAATGPRRLWTERRSEEHTTELQSRGHLVCRLLLEKKKPECGRITRANDEAFN